MKRVGIVCECNPFHSGHKYLIGQARAAGADVIACVMSGYFTQRGEAAICDPYLRARSVVEGCADLVVELPFPYAASGAEFFANAGVEILSRLGIDELWFGSECGDVTLLERAADVAQDKDFCARYAASAATSAGTAEAYLDALSQACGGVRFSSNDTLGIAYVSAIRRLGADILPVTVKRTGSAYLDDTVASEGHPSATALRRALREGARDGLPLLSETRRAIEDAERVGNAFADLHLAERAILAHLRMRDPDELEAVAELSGGLGNRLHSVACQVTSLDALIEGAMTKKYTRARLWRGILFALTGVGREDLRRAPAYTRLLAANDVGCAYLSAQRKQKTLDVVTKQSEIPLTEDAQRQARLHQNALSLYTLCLPTARAVGELLVKNPVILK